MMKKMIGFAAFITTGSGLLIGSFMKGESITTQALVAAVVIFYAIGLKGHLGELQN